MRLLRFGAIIKFWDKIYTPGNGQCILVLVRRRIKRIEKSRLASGLFHNFPSESGG